MNVYKLNNLNSNNKEITINIAPQTWYGRLLVTMLAALLLWLAFAFFTLFLVVGSVAVLVLAARILWTYRKFKDKNPEKIIDGEVSIEQSNTSQIKTVKKLMEENRQD